MYYVKELCVKLVTYQMSYHDARSAKYKILYDKLLRAVISLLSLTKTVFLM